MKPLFSKRTRVSSNTTQQRHTKLGPPLMRLQSYRMQNLINQRASFSTFSSSSTTTQNQPSVGRAGRSASTHWPTFAPSLLRNANVRTTSPNQIFSRSFSTPSTLSSSSSSSIRPNLHTSKSSFSQGAKTSHLFHKYSKQPRDVLSSGSGKRFIRTNFPKPHIASITHNLIHHNLQLLHLCNTALLSTSRLESGLQINYRGFSTSSNTPADPSGESPKKLSLLEKIKEEASHLWHGSRLLAYEIKTSARILWSLRHGDRKMTRRERRQLLRTAADMFRVVPFAIFVLVPFLEFALPLALYFFPNMLPSTFEKEDQKQASRTKKLKLKIDLAMFLQDTLKHLKTQETQSNVFESIMEKVREGEHVPKDEMLNFCKQFKDELVLDNLSRGQLVAICKFMGVVPFGNDSLLKFLLRKKMQAIKAEDKEILQEGVSNLTIEELQNALRDRGMRGSSKFRPYLEMRLKEWLDLSLNHQVPLTLLIISRTFVITETEKTEDLLKEALSSLSDDTLEDQTADAITDPKIKYQALKSQQEKIEEERQREEVRIKEEREEEARLQKQQEEERKERKRKLEETRERLKQKEQLVPEGTPEVIVPEVMPTSAVMPETTVLPKTTFSTSEIPPATPPPMTAQVLTGSSLASEIPVASATEKPSFSSESVLKEEGDDDSEGRAIPDTSAPAQPSLNEKELVEIAEKLATLAGSSYLEKEQKTLQRLKLRLMAKPKEQVEIAVGRIIEKIIERHDEDETGDEITKGLQNRLNTMVEQLEKEVTDVDQEVGDKYRLLDLDRDGTITVEELAGVVRIWKDKYSEQEIEEIISKLDVDRDGKISIEELRKLSRDFEEEEEDDEIQEENLEAQISRATSSIDSKIDATLEKESKNEV